MRSDKLGHKSLKDAIIEKWLMGVLELTSNDKFQLNILQNIVSCSDLSGYIYVSDLNGFKRNLIFSNPVPTHVYIAALLSHKLYTL